MTYLLGKSSALYGNYSKHRNLQALFELIEIDEIELIIEVDLFNK